jgi:hypothetical protein
LQAVKSLGLTGSRKLRTIKSKRRVCLICNNADNTNLETFIANEYLTPPTTGFTGTVSHSQAIQTSAATGVYFVTGTSATAQEVQTSAATGVYLLTGTVAHSQKRQTSAAVGNNNSVFVVVPETGGYRRRRYYIPAVSGYHYSYQAKQKQWSFGDLIIKAFSAMWQKKSHSKAAGGMQIIGKSENKKLRQVEKTNGFIVTAEDELITILKLLDVA